MARIRRLGARENTTLHPDFFLIPEPTPDWKSAKDEWKWAWHLHCYGFTLLFMMLSFHTALSLVALRRRIKSHCRYVALNSLLLLLGLSRAVYLLFERYESLQTFPTPLSRLLFGVAFPCLTSSYSLIQLVVMRVTKVPTSNEKRMRSYTILAFVITSHFSVVIVVDVTVAYKNSLKLLLLICQAVFITWGLVLSFTFIYSSFRLTQFSSEAHKVLRQLAYYQKNKKNGKRTQIFQRVAKPRLNESSMVPSSEEDDMDSYLKQFGEDIIRKRHSNKKGRVNKCDSNLSTSGDCQDSSRPPSPKVLFKNSTCVVELQDITVEEGGSRTSLIRTERGVSNPAFSNGHDQSEVQVLLTDFEDERNVSDNRRETADDSGYSADGELNEGQLSDVDETRETPEYTLNNSERTISLQRVKQGRILKTVLKSSYAATLCTFLACILRLYGMFGVYGVLSNEHKPEPWPWFVYQTFCR